MNQNNWLPDSFKNIRPRILVVDDQPMNVRVLYELFRQECDVLMAINGEQAIGIACAQQPDLILLDILMPDMSGHEVCRLLKIDPATRDIPIIFITGQQDAEDEITGFELGAVDFITKPINPVIVRARVRTHLILKLQNDALHSIALVDGLTGLANRRNFDESLERNWRRCMRENIPLSAAMIDIDHFKQYNDHYGHRAGDICLRTVAQAIKGVMQRPFDLVARYGGEEFVCLLPNTDSQGATTLAQRAINTVNELKLEHSHSSVGKFVSVSVGIVTITPDSQHSADELIAAADEKLYAAKNSGRNQFFAGVIPS